jgi:Na+-translocating ferredoxin:NAD+ oxidoreductase RnfG subunit
MKRFVALVLASLASAGTAAGGIETALMAQSGGAGAQPKGRASIERVFDRNKGGLYALYRQALNESPGLKGKIDFDIDIAADGTVTDCRVVLNQLTRDLGLKMCDRIRQMQFGAQTPQTIRKPVSFYPAA